LRRAESDIKLIEERIETEKREFTRKLTKIEKDKRDMESEYEEKLSMLNEQHEKEVMKRI
jgi:hypothetical protein